MKQKKLIMGVFVAIIASASLVTSAGATGPQSDITGVITENQTAVADAKVTVTCNGHTETDTTDAFGSYLVTFQSGDCPFGTTVKVAAQKGTMSGVASGTVQGITTKLNLAIVNVSIPEYGMIGGIIAGGAGVGMIAFARRRQKQNLQA